MAARSLSHFVGVIWLWLAAQEVTEPAVLQQVNEAHLRLIKSLPSYTVDAHLGSLNCRVQMHCHTVNTLKRCSNATKIETIELEMWFYLKSSLFFLQRFRLDFGCCRSGLFFKDSAGMMGCLLGKVLHQTRLAPATHSPDVDRLLLPFPMPAFGISQHALLRM